MSDRAIVPVRMGALRAVVLGGAAVTRAAAYAAAILLLGTLVIAILSEELLGDADIDLLARGAMVSLGILTLVGALGEPMRIAAERGLLLRDAELDARRAAQHGARPALPPIAERQLLQRGPHGYLAGLAMLGIIVGGVCLPIGLGLAADDREALLARILVPSLSGVLLFGGIALAWVSRGRGRARDRWGDRLSAVAERWRPGCSPVARAHEQRRLRILGVAGTALGMGAAAFVGGIFMRQPGRHAEPVRWEESGERAIDGLLLTGGALMGAAVAALLAVQGGLLLWTAIRDRRTVRALERGERVLLERVDAILLDPSAVSRGAVVLGVLGWLAVAYGWAPTFIAGIESPEQTVALAPVTALVTPGAAAIAIGWVLGSIGAARHRRRRARVQAVLARDPLPGEDRSEPADRRADAVRDIILLTDRSGS